MQKTTGREHLPLDFDWRFALGHAFDARRDFGHDTGHFSYFAKTGYGDGAAAQHFDDRGWRRLDLPHDWCAELPFDARGGHSHGYKAIGRNFPQNSVGWYRKSFFIPETDPGRRISLEFEGVHRNAAVWVNGFYIGTEHSGSTGFSYDVSDYLDYGGDNVVAVRVDATTEEGWYYEGAGIYRRVWLTKTHPLHVARYGVFVTTDLQDDAALIAARTTVVNESQAAATFDIEETVVDAEGQNVLTGHTRRLSLQPGEQKEFRSEHRLEQPRLWSLESPHLYSLETLIRSQGAVVDACETAFGVRTARFDPDEGFLLNGQCVKLVGVNLHQDHAGVGVAVPDALHEYRLRRMKAMGCNAVRSSHHPPAPAFLEACDRLGVLVIDENRLMGCNPEHFSCLERLIKRDRNHPSVAIWSLGNEEWAIEGNEKGIRITATMQTFAQRLDDSRAFTVACSGGWDTGSGTAAQVIGYNYLVQGDIDAHHAKFPWQAGVGTEETTTHQTRGVHATGEREAYLPPTNRMPENVGTESGWQFYAARPFLGGLFYWTGFDYRGEPDPFAWPVVVNQSGLVDLCGFAKDGFYYLRAWWGKEPSLHIAPHWNWKGREGQEIKVTVYSNCEQVALCLNGQRLGQKDMPRNGHLEWRVPYRPGVLTAQGYTGGRETVSARTETAGKAAALQLVAERRVLRADGRDVAVVAVQVNDRQGRLVPSAANEIRFTLEGPGEIIGVGNGDPLSHEPDRFFESVRTFPIKAMKELTVDGLDARPEVAPGFDDSGWKTAFQPQSADWQVYLDPLLVARGVFELPAFTSAAEINLFTKSVLENQSVYVNGRLLAADIRRDAPGQAFRLEHAWVHPGRNVYAVTGQRFRKKNQWEILNTDPGLAQVIEPAKPWKRKAFNGLAQVIVRATGELGEITLTAAANGLAQAVLTVQAQDVASRFAQPE
ncbi:MAG: beta-galactosidase GalA [Anaerolineales bacterium]